MDGTIDWLCERPYYEGQIVDRRTQSGHNATFADLEIESGLADALGSRGIDRFFAHQANAIEEVRAGQHVVLATPTASGKSLAYTVPAVERAQDHLGTTLYIGPQVALINDQAETLTGIASDLGFGSRVTVDRYTGQLSRSEKESVRDRQPTILLTTPDMLHYGIMPHGHRLWDWFFERLETVVIDEIHEYRGVFGSHVSLVLRRLNRLCQRFGSDPQYICCSATIGNPGKHAATVTGKEASDYSVVDHDDSAGGQTHWLLWNPPEYGDSGWGSGRRRSSHVEAHKLFVDIVERGYQTAAFTGSRQTAERYADKSATKLRERGETELASAIAAYQAGLTDDRREELESGLFDGSIRGVWCTSALELGVDVGELDVVLLDGYPGTRMQTFQRAGRAGRGTNPSLVILIAGEDQLDQYISRNPDALFGEPPENAVTNPGNETILPAHVCSAARETWLRPDDDHHFGEGFPGIVTELQTTGDLERRETDDGLRWLYAGERSPQHELSLRTVGNREIILRTRDGEKLGSLPFIDALRDAHPGAIYHHQGRTYEVIELDLDHDIAELDRTWADYFTRVLHDKRITVDQDNRETTLSARDDVNVHLADITMHKQIVGYERRDSKSGTVLGSRELDLPETTLETTALYYVLPTDLDNSLRAIGDFPGGIHAAEHAMIAMFPFSFLCDRRDIGGLSTPVHPHTNRSTIFIYDGYPGGVGLSQSGFENVDDLVRSTHGMVNSCHCSNGCPACVQSPYCGNGNEPLDKGVAVNLLAEFAGR